MSDKVVPFPTEEYIDKLSVDKMIEELVRCHQGNSIANLMVVRFDKDGNVSVGETGGLTLAQMSYGIAVLTHHLHKWIDK